MRTLEEIEQLEQSRYGRPSPRHGLKLLYWFAKNCLSFKQNNVMLSHCYPSKGHFGFHTFENKYERNGYKLLPDVALPYYEVGNLSKPAAEHLPSYVREDYTGLRDRSNKDRIIVSLNNKWLHSIYVTEHSDWSSFNKQATYCISKHLIRMIRDLTLEEFLLKTGYSKEHINTHGPTELRNQLPSVFAPLITSINIQVQDLHTEAELPLSLVKNNTQGHHEAPSKSSSSICTPASSSSKNQDLHTEAELPLSLIRNNTQGHHEAPSKSSSSICTPAPTSLTTQDLNTEAESPFSLINNNTQGHHEALSTSPAHTSSPNQDFHTKIELPTDIQTIFTLTPSPFLQMNSFFWGFCFVFLFLFFFFLWTDAMKVSTIIVFLSSSFRWKKRNKAQIHAVTTNAFGLNVKSPRNQSPDTDPSPISQINSYFWVFYFLCLFIFFYYFWGTVMQIFLIAAFLFQTHISKKKCCE
ncbi:hypothetical protein C0J45_1259 [Silurus meridionalis]|nr:hypothetical protein C0J45_1259 [Silurus meridionalis]